MRLFGLDITKAQPGDRVQERQVFPNAFAADWGITIGPTTWSWYELVQAYTSWVYIAIDKIAKTTAMLPLELYTYRGGKSGKLLTGTQVKRELKALETDYKRRRWLKAHAVEKEQVLEHPFLELMRRPNHVLTRYGLWYDTMVKMELAGSCGWYLPANGLGQPGEVWVLPLTENATLRAIPDPKMVIAGYEYRDADVLQRFTVEEVLFMRYPSPKSPLVGQSPLTAQTFPYNVDKYLDQYEYYMLHNRAVPGLNLHTDLEISPTKKKEIQEQVSSDFSGVKKSGGLFVTHSGFKIGLPINQNIKDVLVDQAARGIRDKLLATFDVPAGAVGLIDDVNRATMEVIAETFITQCIKPRLMLVEEYIETFVLPRYDERLTCDFELPQFSERALDLQERRENLSSGYSTINEEREKAGGLEPVEWGDAPWLSFGLAQPTVTGALEEEEPAPVPPALQQAPAEGQGEEGQPPEKGHSTKAQLVTAAYWTEKRRRAHWETYVKEHQRWENLLAGTARKLFREQLAGVLDTLRSYEPKCLAHMAGWPRATRAEWVKAKDGTAPYNIDKQAERKRVMKLFAPALKSLLNDFGTRRGESLLGVQKAVGVGFAFDVSDPRVEKWLGTRLEEFSKEITDVTFDEVKAILREGFEAGASSAAISQTLRDKFESWDKYRAPLIARTETTAGSNFADLEAVHQAGLEGRLLKIWISSRDEAVRDTHRQAERDSANGIPIDEDFEVGEDSMQAPGGGTEAEENINCRCTLGYLEAEVEE